MPALEIRHLSGATEAVQLSKEMPISIGRHPSNDIQLDDESVSQLHCRVSWRKSSYSVNAASDAKIDLNGELVVKAKIKTGDVITIAGVKIAMVDEVTPRRDDRANADISEFELKPLDEDEVRKEEGERLVRSDRSEEEKPEPPDKPDSRSKKQRTKSRKSKPKPPPSESVAELSLGDIVASSDDLAAIESTAPKPKREEKVGLTTKPVRPGDRDVLRSPLVLTLAGGGLLILLLAATFALMNQRQAVESQFSVAMEFKEGGKYSQAIREFNTFLVDYPRHELTGKAKVMLGLASIQQYVAGATPAWEQGLASVRAFRKDYQDLAEYKEDEVAKELQGYVTKIALGSATSAKNNLNPELLTISDEAASLLGRIAVNEKAKDKSLQEIETMVAAAKEAILKNSTLDEAVGKIEQALKSGKPIVALQARRELLIRYPEFGSSRKVSDLLARALEAEKKLITQEQVGKAAVTDDKPTDVSSTLSLARHSRARSGDQSVGEGILVLSEDCCYRVDTITGMPLWRVVIGFDTPFFPFDVTSVDGLLVFNTYDQELRLISRTDGRLIWRIAVGGQATGKPVLHGGQIFLPTASENPAQGGHLCQIDLETGELTSRLSFSQPLSSAPAVSDDGEDGKYLFLAGREGVMYILTRRPLACASVFDSGHAPGTIEAPLMAMGKYLLAVENDRQQSCRLRLYDTEKEAATLSQVAEQRLEGHVRDYPVLRGNRLFVPSSDERITAFTVADEKGQSPLTRVAGYQNEAPVGCPIYLATGPDERLWMAARDMRKFQLTLENIVPDENRIEVGLASQPLQVNGNSLYIAGRRPTSRAVFFQGTDRQAMSGKWQVVLGTPVLATTAPGSGDDTLSCITATGDLFRVTESQLGQGGFQSRPTSQLRVQGVEDAGYHAALMQDGRLAVYTDGEKPHLWLINSSGAVEKNYALSAPLQTAPATVAGASLLPLPGRLQFVGKPASGGTVQDFLAPVTGESAPLWRQLASLEDDQVLVLSDSTKLSRFQFRVQQVSYLEEVTPSELEYPVDVGMTVAGDRLFLADSKPSLNVLDCRSLGPIATVDLPQPAAQTPWLVDGRRLLVQCGRERLICYEASGEFSELWGKDLPDTSLAGSPRIIDGAMMVALQDGQIWRLNPDTGELVGSTGNMGQALTHGPYQLGDAVVVISADGSVLTLRSQTEKAAQ